MKRLLVTGASGFLGRAVVKHYRAQGWQVSTMGRRKEDNYTLQNIATLEFSERFDRLIHTLAVNETELMHDLDTSYQMNVVLTRQLVELCKKNEIKEFIYFSTFHVYGRSFGNINETASVAPKNDYALTHYLSERIVTDLADYAGYNPLILRPTNIYGVPESLDTFFRWSLVPFDFVRRAVRHMEIRLNNPGVQRNFVSVADVIAATELQSCQKILNVFGTDTMTIEQFAYKVVETVPNSQSQIQIAGQRSAGQEPVLDIQTQSTSFLPRSQLVDFIREFAEMVAQDE